MKTECLRTFNKYPRELRHHTVPAGEPGTTCNNVSEMDRPVYRIIEEESWVEGRQEDNQVRRPQKTNH